MRKFPAKFFIRKNRETGKWELFSRVKLYPYGYKAEYALAAKFKSQQKAIKYLTKMGMI